MIELNLKTRAAAQTTVPFNSMCKFGEHYLGATTAGLFRINGFTDAGTAIPALIKTGKIDLGTERLKSIRYIYFGMEATGDLELTLYVDGVEKLTRTIPQPPTGRQMIRVPIPRGLKGRYWEFKIENTDGCFFVLYSVKIFPVVLLSTH